MTTIQNDQQAAEQGELTPRAVLAPLFTWRGMDVYPVRGSEDDDSTDDDSDSEPGDGDAGEGGESGSEGSSDTVSREDFLKLQNQLKAADKRRDEAEKRLKKIDDANKDELTKATERAAEFEKQVKERDGEIADLRLQNAFLTAETGITWHDPGDALALAERKGYLEGVVDEDGKVDSKKLGAKLKEMAGKHSYLVKTGADSDNGGEDKPPASGGKVGSKGKKADEAKIPDRYNKFLKI